MLVHICCSVDSHYFLQSLKTDFPNERLVGYFYNPNIHPKAEYDLRLADAARSCDILGIELLDGEYDYEEWLQSIRGLENCPEKGERCEACFEQRFIKTALKAVQLGFTRYTSTLLQSPLKDKSQVCSMGIMAGQHHGIAFVMADYVSGGGKQAQDEVIKKERLYRQNYCGCMFGLLPQRAHQNRLPMELFSPLRPQVQPASVESRKLYYEELGQKPIQKNRRLIYRLLSGGIAVNGQKIDSYILAYSCPQKPDFKAKVYARGDNCYLLDKQEAKLLSLDDFNALLGRSYESVRQITFDPPSHNEECEMRIKVAGAHYDLSFMSVVNCVDVGAVYEIDMKHELVTLSVEA